MTTTITIKAGDAPVQVISEKIIEDGRQRLQNGVDDLAPGEEQTFIIHEKQSLRIVELPIQDVQQTTEGEA